MQRNFYKLFSVLVLVNFLFVGCSEQKIDEENVFQLNNVGLRKGVFERRFKLAKEYSENSDYSPELLKKFLKRVVIPEYLFIQRAIDLKFDNDPLIKNSILEFGMNALSSLHPIRTKELFISDNEIEQYKNEKKYSYNFTLIQHPSYLESKKISKDMTAGIEISKKNEAQAAMFPKMYNYKNKSYGQSLPIEIYNEIRKMKVGEVSEPIYTAPIWVVIKLDAKNKIKKKTVDKESEQSLLNEFHGYKNVKVLRKFIESLKTKYNCKINSVSDKVINTFSITEDNFGYFKRSIYEGSLNDDLIIESDKQNISVGLFFYLFNRSNRFSRLEKIDKQDVIAYLDDLSTQLVLYLDALDKNLDKNETIRDQIENKLNRALYGKFLKEEISDKVDYSVEEARVYYNENRDLWPGEFDKIKSSIINKKRSEIIYKLKEDLIDELSSDYNIKYNEPLLNELAEKFSKEKKVK